MPCHITEFQRNSIITAPAALTSAKPVQADAGAQVVQIFDSWASELQPQDFDIFAGPYIKKIIDNVRETHPQLAIILYISGSGGLLERMAGCKPDIVSIDQRVDLADAIKRIGPSFAVQVG